MVIYEPARTYDMYLVLDLRCGLIANKPNMNKSFKLLSQLFCGVVTSCLTSTAVLSAEPKPPSSTNTLSIPSASKSPNYSFFPGLTFSIFPGTVPRPAFATGTITPPAFPLVEVLTPGMGVAQRSGTVPIVRKRKRPVVEEPEPRVRRRRITNTR